MLQCDRWRSSVRCVVSLAQRACCCLSCQSEEPHRFCRQSLSDGANEDKLSNVTASAMLLSIEKSTSFAAMTLAAPLQLQFHPVRPRAPYEHRGLLGTRAVLGRFEADASRGVFKSDMWLGFVQIFTTRRPLHRPLPRT